MQFVGDVFVDVFIHRALPINRGEQMDKVDAQGGGNEQQVVFGDTQRAAFDFGDGAARGVVPAGKLQLDGKFLLRPAVALAQFDDLPPDQIQLLHLQPGQILMRFNLPCSICEQNAAPVFTANPQGRL